jgi:predicted RNase H-like HicB family nuclease
MKKVYPIVMTKGEKYIVVFVPDFNINTQGIDCADAMEMARDAIGLMGIDMEDEKEPIPEPSNLDDIKKGHEDDMITLVDVDFSEYRRKMDMRTVRRNVTLPSWLNYEAEKSGINVSAVLQEGLKRALHVSGPNTP